MLKFSLFVKMNQMSCPSTRMTNLLPKTKYFCPDQNVSCPGQIFCPWLEMSIPKTKIVCLFVAGVPHFCVSMGPEQGG